MSKTVPHFSLERSPISLSVQRDYSGSQKVNTPSSLPIPRTISPLGSVTADKFVLMRPSKGRCQACSVPEGVRWTAINSVRPGSGVRSSITPSPSKSPTAARSRLGRFAYDLYPNYEWGISGFCHFSHCDKCIDPLTLLISAWPSFRG